MTYPLSVIVPVSPILSHPDTCILDQTLDSVRYHLPDAEIIVTFDGVRPEQEHRRADYDEFTRRALWRLDKHYGNTAPFIFDWHTHQVGMMRAVIDEIRTPLLLYVEQDCPLVCDEPIDWAAIINLICSGDSNMVRLAHEALILPAHSHMMHGMEDGPFLRTSQWSQRPHIATVDLYRRILDENFSPAANSFIEDKMHGVVSEAYICEGMAGWGEYRCHIYVPEGNNIKRSYTTDGRAGEPKYDETQVF